MSGWYEVRVDIAAQAWPAVEAALEALGAAAITQSGGDTALFAEPGVASAERWSRFVVEALFDDGHDVDALAAALHAVLGADTPVSIRRVAEQDWQSAWQAGWQPLVFGRDLCVCPSWCEPPPGMRHVIRLDPGQAFGTGTHESTALCLEWLAAAAPLDGLTVIDYGCGSGVLALAAAALGAREVLAVDIDADALATARDNVAANGAAGRVTVGTPALVDGRAVDVLVANILQAPLLALAPRFATLVGSGGRLVLAGLLADQAEAVRAAYAPAFALDLAASRGEWVLLGGARRADC